MKTAGIACLFKAQSVQMTTDSLQADRADAAKLANIYTLEENEDSILSVTKLLYPLDLCEDLVQISQTMKKTVFKP